MATLIQDLATQMLELTRVVTNAPNLAPNEPLRVDIVPAGVGSQVTAILSDSLPLYDYGVPRLKVDYELWQEDILVAEGPWLTRIPAPAKDDPITTNLLSTAFVLIPQVRFVSGVGTPPAALTSIPHKLVVTLTVEIAGLTPISRKIEIPFRVPVVHVVVPAVCICSKHAGMSTDVINDEEPQFLVLVAPGGPDTLDELVTLYNQAIDTVSALQDVLDLASVVLTPLKKVVELLAVIPKPYVSTDKWVLDFDVFDDFDDEMRSFLLVAPDNFTVQFSDEANPTSWDAGVQTIGIKTYKPVDLLRLVGTDAEEAATPKSQDLQRREYYRTKLGMNPTLIKALRQKIMELTGFKQDAASLGLCVMFLENMIDNPDENPDHEVLGDLLRYDNENQEPVCADTASARWLTAT